MSKYIYPLNILMLVGICSAVNAQKLPDVQEVNKIAPTNLRVDGKNLEWNDAFLANNKRTQLSYTLCNDANNLYLAVKSADGAAINKIMAGGISFAVNVDDKKKEKDAPTITYPVIKRNNGRGGRGRGSFGRMQGGRGQGGREQLTAEQRDSIAAEAHRGQLALVKEIKIDGFKQITDSLISIYNEYGIKSFASIDDKGVFFYELAIPLKELGISSSAPQEFAYNIKLNGLQIQGFEGGFGGGNGGGGFGGGGGGGGNRGGSRPGGYGAGNVDMQSLMSPTDFWGKYTLAK